MNTNMSTSLLEDQESTEQPPNDCIKTAEQLAVEVNALAEEQDGNEQLALRLAWEAGGRLNQMHKMLTDEKGWGRWGKFLDEHCPNISRMTVWRYRSIARFYNSVLQFDGMTLSEAYRQMDLAKFKEEGENGSEGGGASEKPDRDGVTVVLFKKLAKLSVKFDVPETLSPENLAVMKRGAMKLVEVLASARKPVAHDEQDKDDAIEVEAVVSSEGEEE